MTKNTQTPVPRKLVSKYIFSLVAIYDVTIGDFFIFIKLLFYSMLSSLTFCWLLDFINANGKHINVYKNGDNSVSTRYIKYKFSVYSGFISFIKQSKLYTLVDSYLDLNPSNTFSTKYEYSSLPKLVRAANDKWLVNILMRPLVSDFSFGVNLLRIITILKAIRKIFFR